MLKWRHPEYNSPMHTRSVRIAVFVLSLLLNNMPVRAADGEFGLAYGKAGAIHSGMTIDELYAAAGREKTTLVDKFAEGYFSPAIEVYSNVDGRRELSLNVEVVPQSGKFLAGRITVYDARFKTEAGIGVGSTLSQIRRAYKVDWITFGEGPLIARVEQIGTSFALDFTNPPSDWYTTHDQNLIPGSARVTFILVTGGTGGKNNSNQP